LFKFDEACGITKDHVQKGCFPQQDIEIKDTKINCRDNQQIAASHPQIFEMIFT